MMANTSCMERSISSGLTPVSVNDIECVSNVAHEQAQAMAAMFRTIARLSEDREIRTLCEHGALQGDLQANEIDAVRERAVEADLDASGVRHD